MGLELTDCEGEFEGVLCSLNAPRCDRCIKL